MSYATLAGAASSKPTWYASSKPVKWYVGEYGKTYFQKDELIVNIGWPKTLEAVNALLRFYKNDLSTADFDELLKNYSNLFNNTKEEDANKELYEYSEVLKNPFFHDLYNIVQEIKETEGH